MTKLCFTVPGSDHDVEIFHETGSLEVRAFRREDICMCMHVKVCVLFMSGDFQNHGRGLKNKKNSSSSC